MVAWLVVRMSLEEARPADEAQAQHAPHALWRGLQGPRGVLRVAGRDRLHGLRLALASQWRPADGRRPGQATGLPRFCSCGKVRSVAERRSKTSVRLLDDADQ